MIKCTCIIMFSLFAINSISFFTLILLTISLLDFVSFSISSLERPISFSINVSFWMYTPKLCCLTLWPFVCFFLDVEYFHTLFFSYYKVIHTSALSCKLSQTLAHSRTYYIFLHLWWTLNHCTEYYIFFSTLHTWTE